MDFRKTLNLPDPNFTIPMKADLPNLEPRIQARWEEIAIYHRIQESRAGAPTFVLHDGPPYTNSAIHMGTALNKILKDLVVKSRTMMGFRAPYVPGYDNHGLPIEQAVQRKLHEKKITPTPAELIQACRDHADEFIKIQTDQFKRLGVFGLWELPYRTMEFAYEAELVRVFKRLVEGGYVYKGLRPTLWSPTSRTALADTEIVYKEDHVSKAIYVRFPLLNDPTGTLTAYPNLYTVIWTTTPWTIPSNLACAFHPEFEYAVVKAGDAHYLILSDLVEKVAAAVGWEGHEVVARMAGQAFEGVSFKHPIFDRPSVAVFADYVTTEDGTGVVHTAPSHGRDDFYTGQKYNLGVPNTVDERGYLTHEAGEFEGVFFRDCDTVVVDRLREVGALLDVRDYVHSYPYAERDEKPVIFRATEQWFLNIDHDGLRERMLEAIRPAPLDAQNGTAPETGVTWVPEAGHNRIEAMVKNRPDWCVSRQRPWGVGVPIFYGATSRVPVLDPVAIEAVAQLVEREGSGAWKVREPHEILPEGYVHPETGETEFVKETDVLDVWFDSGASSLVVLGDHVHPEWAQTWPADLYLEGSDQHRGWFNTSLILGTATRGRPPYRTVVTHGFVTDGEGRKMSKRLGNVIDPVKASETYGADILRTWVASVDYASDVPCSDALLKQVGDGYRTIRNTLRFLIGNLNGFDPSLAANQPTEELDAYIVELADLLVAESVVAYRGYDFNAVLQGVHNFCAKDVSKFYADVIKDRMYCDATESPARVSGQIACYRLLVSILKLVAPILVHTAEETWLFLSENGLLPEGSPSTIHAATFDAPNEARLAEIAASGLGAKFGVIRAVRDDVNGAFEAWKGTDDVKDSQDAVATLRRDAESLAVLQGFTQDQLATFFKLSWIKLEEGEASVSFAKSGYAKCVRSRLRRPDVETVVVDGEEVTLTRRDRAVLGV